MAEYKQGQVVKVDIPKTYGIISKVTHDETFSWVETYWVKFMKPFMGLVKGKHTDNDEKTNVSLYQSNSVFGNALHVIDPAAEIQRLKKLKAKGVERIIDMKESIDEVIAFLTEHLPSVPQSATLETTAQ